MISIDRQDHEHVLVKFDTQEEFGDAVLMLFREHSKYGNPVHLIYLPPGIPKGDILRQPGYVGLRR